MPLNAHFFPALGKTWEFANEYWEIVGRLGSASGNNWAGGQYRTRTCDPHHVKASKDYFATRSLCTTYSNDNGL